MIQGIWQMTISIHSALQDEKSHIVDFQLKMAWETESMHLDRATVEQGVEAVFNDPSKGYYLLAKSGDQTIASMLLTPEWSDWRNKTFLWIQSLYVVPAFRKRGVFKKLYDHIKIVVQNSPEYAGLKLYVDHDNLPAQLVYKRVGMDDSHYKLYEWNK